MQVSYVAVASDGREFFKDLNISELQRRDDSDERRQVAEAAVREWGMTSPRTKELPEPVVVKVHRIVLEKGEAKRLDPTRVPVHPPLEDYTQETFENAAAELLKELPPPFRAFAYDHCWQHGHAYGYDEVISFLAGMTPDLKKAIEEYDKNKSSEKEQTS